jgi:DnaJ-class molecular chaperone
MPGLVSTWAYNTRGSPLIDAYDIVGASPDDPTDLVKELYRKKSTYYHPDKGGSRERFERLTKALETILKSRGDK